MGASLANSCGMWHDVCGLADEGKKTRLIPSSAAWLPVDRVIPGTPYAVGDFWQWAFSDLRENVIRGIFVEFLVAKALGDPAPMRRAWQAFDVTAADGTRVEVKSAGYLQSWTQAELSRIVFGGLKARAWTYEDNVFEAELRYQADVYVFVVNTCQEHDLYDPLDLSAYEFYALAVDELLRAGSPKSVSLARVREMAGTKVELTELSERVRELRFAGEQGIPVSPPPLRN